MSKPTADEIRRALRECLEATRAVDEIHDREPPGGAPVATRAGVEAAADAAVHQERLARDKLAGLVNALAGPAPCCIPGQGIAVALVSITRRSLATLAAKFEPLGSLRVCSLRSARPGDHARRSRDLITAAAHSACSPFKRGTIGSLPYSISR